MTPATRILIVEDNALNLELATELLRAQGHAVSQARTAEEGLRLARIAGFDAYVTKPIVVPLQGPTPTTAPPAPPSGAGST